MRNDSTQLHGPSDAGVVTLAHWTAMHGPRRRASAVRARAGAPALALELDLERQRRQAYVSTLAHELRQPLYVISAAMEVLRLGPDAVATARALDIMQRQIGQMSRAVEDLLDEARWARGKVALRKERLDVRAVVKDAALDIAADAAAHGHALAVTVATEPLYVDADPQRLHQVFSNLLRNAVKYTEPGGCITLDARRTAATITVRVSDTGCGIGAAALPHIFELFAQVQSSEGSGVGIGLAVSREIVRLHDGQIEARSAGLGRGSDFIVTLPVASTHVFPIDVFPTLGGNHPAAPSGPTADIDDAADLDRMDDEGGSQLQGGTATVLLGTAVRRRP